MIVIASTDGNVRQVLTNSQLLLEVGSLNLFT